MTPQDVAPSYLSWPEHLKELDDQTLSKLACDYRWLTDENKPEEQEFRGRREAIIKECERRGKPELANVCRSPIRASNMSQPENLG